MKDSFDAEHDIDRLVRIKGADLGFFVVSLYSVVERFLRENYPEKMPDGKNEYPFYKVLNDYKNYLLENKINFNENSIKEMGYDYKNTNDVRHEFKTIPSHKVNTSLKYFIDFSKATGWYKYKEFKKITDLLLNWTNSELYDSDELKRLLDENKKISLTLNDKEKELLDFSEKYRNLEKINQKLELSNTKNDKDYQKLLEQASLLKEELKGKKELERSYNFLKELTDYSSARHDYVRQLTTLSEEQTKIIQKLNLDKDFVVSGTAGTGKTLVMLKAIEKAVNEKRLTINNGKSNFNLLAYNKTLANYNRYISGLLNINVDESVVCTVDTWLSKMLSINFSEKEVIYKENYFLKQKQLFKPTSKRDSKFLYCEAVDFIWANGITREEYIDEHILRKGMGENGGRVGVKEREEIWESIENTENELLKANKWPKNFAAKVLIQDIKNNPEKYNNAKVDYIFIDEAQDLSLLTLRFIKKIVLKSVIMASDAGQSIYNHNYELTEKENEDKKINKAYLHINFRNPSSVFELAQKYREMFLSSKDTLKVRASRPGLPYIFDNQASDANQVIQNVVNKIRFFINVQNYEPESICVVAATNRKIDSLKKNIESNLGIEANQITESFSFKDTKGIKLCTLSSCKGLDFTVCIVCLDEEWLPSDEGLSAKENDRMQHSLIYVALTRAMELLCIVTKKHSSNYTPAVKDLISLLTENKY